MKFPIHKIIFPNHTFSKLLLTNNIPTVYNDNRYKTSFGWICKKEYRGTTNLLNNNLQSSMQSNTLQSNNNNIIYDIVTFAKYDYNREQPNDACLSKVILYSKDYEYSIHENCKLEFYNNYNNVKMNYNISDTNSCIKIGDYSIPYLIYKNINMSDYYNDEMKKYYNNINQYN